MTPACAEDFRLLARRRLPRFLFDYIDGGSYSEVTLRRNVAEHLLSVPTSVSRKRPSFMTSDQVSTINEWIRGLEVT